MRSIVIGKHTLESLTSGMYSDPYVVFREYIQNSVDSVDEAIRAKVWLGDSVMKSVHRIVAEVFVPNPYGYSEVNHKDGNKKNNCAANLEWVTHKRNIEHARETGLIKNRGRKIPQEIVMAILSEYIPNDRNHSTTALGRKYGVSHGYVWKLINDAKNREGNAR